MKKHLKLLHPADAKPGPRQIVKKQEKTEAIICTCEEYQDNKEWEYYQESYQGQDREYYQESYQGQDRSRIKKM